MAARTSGNFCIDMSVAWRLVSWAPDPAIHPDKIRARIEAFERFTDRHGNIRYLSYAATPVGAKAPSLRDQTRFAVDIALLRRAISSADRTMRFDSLVAKYFQFAWKRDPFEVGEFSHLLGHFMHEAPWKSTRKGGRYKSCKLQKLPVPPDKIAMELLGVLGLERVPPDSLDTLYLYLQHQDAMDELATR